MSSLLLAGNPCTSVRVHLPDVGLWVADAVVRGPVPLARGAIVALAVADLTLTGHVYRGEPYTGKGSAAYRIVGGRGGWRRRIPAKGYRDANGVRLSKILADAAAAPASLKVASPAETIDLATGLDRVVGLTWARDAGDAAAPLRRLVLGPWWTRADGVTQVGPRATGAVTGQHDVMDYDPAQRRAKVATDAPAAFAIGLTFTSARLASPILVREVLIEATKGALRMDVYG